jgi:hypothetical protein
MDDLQASGAGKSYLTSMVATFHPNIDPDSSENNAADMTDKTRITLGIPRATSASYTELIACNGKPVLPMRGCLSPR